MADQDLLTKFSCMGTQDRDVLVNDLHEILGSQLSREGCVFFLEMTNWNLQAAVGAYYDFYGQASVQLPQVCVVRDFPVAEGGPVPLATSFTKTWRVKNPGSETWPAGAYVSQWSGHTLGASSTVTLLPCLRPGEEADVSVSLVSPLTSGCFQSQWKMFTSRGTMCGGTLFITVIVEDSTVLGVTEQLSAITTNEGDMDTGGGVSLLGNQPGAAAAGGGSGTAGDRTLNPFGGSPSSLGGGTPGPGQFSQSNASLLPNLILNPSAVSNILPTGANLSNRQLLGSRASELDSSITDRTQPDVIPAQTDVSGANSTQQQQLGNATGQQLGTGIGPHDMMSSDDSGTGDVYPS